MKGASCMFLDLGYMSSEMKLFKLWSLNLPYGKPDSPERNGKIYLLLVALNSALHGEVLKVNFNPATLHK